MAWARKVSKYKAQPTVVDGIRFHSKAEAKRYWELWLLRKAGKIGNLELQPRFVLESVGAQKIGEYIGEYRADFRYHDNRTGREVVEDVKGYMTPLAKWKIKHTEKQYGIHVEIIK